MLQTLRLHASNAEGKGSVPEQGPRCHMLQPRVHVSQLKILHAASETQHSQINKFIFKSRDITLPRKDHIVKAMVFPVVTWGCESWTIKKLECRRVDAFKLWCWRRFLRVPWTARRSNQSILKEITPEYSVEGLMLKVKLQYFGHLMWTADSLEKSLMLGKIEGKRRRGVRGYNGWMASPMQWTWTWANFRRWWGTGRPGVPQFKGSQGQT